MATMEDLHRLCPWAVLATHDVEGSLVTVVCLSVFSLLSARRACSLRATRGCIGYCVGVLADWPGLA